jgi:hypothetical protein
MDKGYEKERFESLSIKTSVAQKFRKYCKTISESQSISLLLMIEFFEYNGLTPNDTLNTTITSLKGQIQKRFNAVIAIIKDIEKSQTKPTTAMLQKLFEEASNEANEEENYDFSTPTLITENEELTYYRKEYHANKEHYNALKNDMETLVRKTKHIKSSFGTGHFRLEITKEEFETLKQKLSDVHHHNPTETRR